MRRGRRSCGRKGGNERDGSRRARRAFSSPRLPLSVVVFLLARVLLLRVTRGVRPVRTGLAVATVFATGWRRPPADATRLPSVASFSGPRARRAPQARDSALGHCQAFAEEQAALGGTAPAEAQRPPRRRSGADGNPHESRAADASATACATRPPPRPRTPRPGQTEWRNLGVQQSRGWEHYAIHRPEPHIMLFRYGTTRSRLPPGAARTRTRCPRGSGARRAHARTVRWLTGGASPPHARTAPSRSQEDPELPAEPGERAHERRDQGVGATGLRRTAGPPRPGCFPRPRREGWASIY